MIDEFVVARRHAVREVVNIMESICEGGVDVRCGGRSEKETEGVVDTFDVSNGAIGLHHGRGHEKDVASADAQGGLANNGHFEVGLEKKHDLDAATEDNVAVGNDQALAARDDGETLLDKEERWGKAIVGVEDAAHGGVWRGTAASVYRNPRALSLAAIDAAGIFLTQDRALYPNSALPSGTQRYDDSNLFWR